MNEPPEFEIMQTVAEIIDSLPKEKQHQVIAFLASRYGLILKDPPSGGGASYRARLTAR